MIGDAQWKSALATTLDGTALEGFGARSEGKVRDSYASGDRRILVTTDRVSAFDHVLGTIPLKGQVLNTMAAFWFERTKHIAPNHVIDVPDPNVLVAHECSPLPVELVMRAYLTGTTSTSMWTHYEAGARTFCGFALPDGLTKHQKLDRPLLTPATKAAMGAHDVSVSREELLASGVITARDFDRAAEIVSALFAFGQEHAAKQGLILADTKYELGKTRSGEIVVIDEIHTPDSSRYWIAESYGARVAEGGDPEALDKDYLRRYLTSVGFRGDGTPPQLPDDVRIEAAKRYVDAFERVSGAAFVPDLQEPHARMAKNLAKLRIP